MSTISKPIDNSCTGLGGTIKKNTKSKANIKENSEIKSSNSSKQLKSIEKEQIDVKLRGQLIVTANGHSMDFPYCNHWNHYRLCPH